MFTGQGSQYVGMGRELFETQSVFRGELERCAEILRPLLDRPILELLFAGNDEDHSLPLLDETQYSARAFRAGVCARDHVAFLGCRAGGSSRS